METLQQVWEAVCDIIKNNISAVAFSSWIGVITPVSLEEDRLHLSVSSAFRKSIIETNYIKIIESACEDVFGFKINVVIRSEQGDITPVRSSAADNQFTFENFIVATSNNFAYTAAKAVSKSPGKMYNPLFIYGDSGLGKTHLLTAIHNCVETAFPDYNIISIQGEDFINEFIESLSFGRQVEFRKKFRTCDMLILDDIQFIANKTAVQEEFFHTFEALHRAGKQIVLSSDRPPKNILSLDSRLRTRFETGLADIESPDFETRVAIVRKKAELCGFVLPDDVVIYIAEKIKSNIRQIMAVVTKLNAKFIMNGQTPSLSLAIETCRDIINDTSTAITTDMIKDEICRVYQLSPDDLSSEKRSAQISLVRQVAIYVTRELTSLTLKEIGDEFGGRHYSTVHTSIENITESLKTNWQLRETVEDIIKNIKSKE